MFGALAVDGSGFDSGAGIDYCDSPHPTSNAAAIVISSCFILRSSGGGSWMSPIKKERKVVI